MAFLHIYDNTNQMVREHALRRAIRERTYLLSVESGGYNLRTALDELVRKGARINRVLFDAEGGPGRIYFGSALLECDWFIANLPGRRYEALCPEHCRVYFSGCNVAAGEEGWRFLAVIGMIFLPVGGGEVFGHTSVGISWEGPGATGHVVHFTGSVRTVTFAPGGRITGRTERNDLSWD